MENRRKRRRRTTVEGKEGDGHCTGGEGCEGNGKEKDAKGMD